MLKKSLEAACSREPLPHHVRLSLNPTCQPLEGPPLMKGAPVVSAESTAEQGRTPPEWPLRSWGEARTATASVHTHYPFFPPHSVNLSSGIYIKSIFLIVLNSYSAHQFLQLKSIVLTEAASSALPWRKLKPRGTESSCKDAIRVSL